MPDVSVPAVAQAVFLVTSSYVIWKFLRATVFSPLHRLCGPPKAHWWKGNFHVLNHKHSAPWHLNLFREYGPTVKVVSLFNKPSLYTTDPKAMSHILIKAQYTYDKPEALIIFNKLMFGTSLLSTLGEHHRKQRKMLNPVFSLKHMRNLLPIFEPITSKLVDILSGMTREGEKEIDMMQWISRAALEIIGVGGLGYSFEALDEGRKNTYSEAIILMIPLQFKLMLYRQFLPWLIKIGTPSFRRWILAYLPIKEASEFRDIVDLMDSTAADILRKKRVAMSKGDEEVMLQVGQGHDILSILLRENAKANEADRLPEHEVIGHMSTFISAGHETTTRAVCRALHQLALYPDVQQKLREEIDQAYEQHGTLDYDALMALPFLEAVTRETLRMFPSSPLIRRISGKDDVLPLQYPAKTTDGKELNEIFVPKGTEVIVAILATNQSELFWGDDCNEWKPQRWLKPLPESVTAAKLPTVYSNIMTFTGGHQACIGFKYAELEMKLMLATLVKAFKFSLSKELYWQFGNLMSPFAVGTDDIPNMPMNVTLVEQK